REWMATYTGPSFAVPRADASGVDVYVTGRDTSNRSRIGVITIDPARPAEPPAIGDVVFDLGDLGAFDENGVSYPWIVDAGGVQHMYYVGWMPTVLTPFQNHMGLALRTGGTGPWRRFSRAPILPRTDEEYLSIGSCAVMKDEDRWRMWYTCFRQWGHEPGDPKHVYVIKYAESSDGRHWVRNGVVCINTDHEGEYAIGRPSVLRRAGVYH